MDTEHLVDQSITLVDLLNNTLIWRQTAPYLPVSSVLALSATTRAIRAILHESPETFRHLNLSVVKSATLADSSPIDSGGISWRSERMDESLTEEDFFSGPLRGIFSKLERERFLFNVKTLVLDGLSVPAELIREVIVEDRFNVKILSIRKVKNLNERGLQSVLHYLVRPAAPKLPKLKALYMFGDMDAPSKPLREAPSRPSQRLVNTGVMSSEGAQIGAQWNSRSEAALSASLVQPQDDWWKTKGRMLSRPPTQDWADTLRACQGIIAFDAVLCRGPRHDSSKIPADRYLRPAIAIIALGSRGCECCGSCPEQPATFDQDADDHFPLLAPPPLHASTVRAAQVPILRGSRIPPPLILRCKECLDNRWCEKCNKWWCEDCYHEPVSRAMQRSSDLPEDEPQQDSRWIIETSSASAGSAVKGVHRDCVGCGRTCEECKLKYIRTCQECGSEYCLEDNESQTMCDWCRYSGRRTRELY